MKNCFSFLSFKGLTHACFLKTSMTYNRNLTPQFLGNNVPISTKYAAYLLFLNLA